MIFYKYRFKTKEEFESTFGIRWKRDVPHSWNDDMDQYLGKCLEIEDDCLLEILDNHGVITYNKNSNKTWTVCKAMLVEMDYTPTYKPKKLKRTI